MWLPASPIIERKYRSCRPVLHIVQYLHMYISTWAEVQKDRWREVRNTNLWKYRSTEEGGCRSTDGEKWGLQIYGITGAQRKVDAEVQMKRSEDYKSREVQEHRGRWMQKYRRREVRITNQLKYRSTEEEKYRWREVRITNLWKYRSTEEGGCRSTDEEMWGLQIFGSTGAQRKVDSEVKMKRCEDYKSMEAQEHRGRWMQKCGCSYWYIK